MQRCASVPPNCSSRPPRLASYPHDNAVAVAVAVAVAATDRHDGLASFSNHGATSVDLGAPGVGIASTVPAGATATASGTSMTAPHVSGALAHLLAAFPAATTAEIRALLLDRGDPVAALETTTVSGRRLDLARSLGLGQTAPELAIADASVTEPDPDQTADLVLDLTAAHPAPVTVEWSTGAEPEADPADTATAGADYTTVAGRQVTIPAGATQATIIVEILGDDLIEPDETVTVRVTSATEVTVADGTVVDDDRPVADVAGPASPVGEADGAATFTVTLSEPSPETVTIGYGSADGTATAGADYSATSGTLEFTPGTTSLAVEVTLLDDTDDEPDETLTLALAAGASRGEIYGGPGALGAEVEAQPARAIG